MKMNNLVKNNQITMKYKILALAILFYACSFAQVGINTSEPITELDVNGKTTIRDTPILEDNNDLKTLYVNEEGLVGVKDFSGGPLTEEFFYAATNYDRNSTQTATDNFNNHITQNFEFDSEDIIYNTIKLNLATIDNNNYFRIGEDGVYEFNGFLNLHMKGNDNSKIFIAFLLEYSEDEGLTWSNLTGSRPVLTLAWGLGQSIPYTFPTTIYRMKKNSLLRVSYYRTKTVGEIVQIQGDTVDEIYFDKAYGATTYKFILKKL